MSGVIKKRSMIPGDSGESVYDLNLFLTAAQFAAELEKCEYCEDKPCMAACPCDCSPADFIKAVSVEEPSDILRSAALIMGKNPLGGICGQTCPDKHCMAACVHKQFDSAVNIPAVQATIIEKAKQIGKMPPFGKPEVNGRSVAVLGAGPAGLGAAAYLGQIGYAVTIYEKNSKAGGMCNLIPDFRLDKEVLKSDIEWMLGLGDIKLTLNREISDPEALLSEGFEAVIVATGLWDPIRLGIPNEDKTVSGIEYLAYPANHIVRGNVAVIGGGATAFDCAMTALTENAERVEIFALENIHEMPLSGNEMVELIKSGIEINGRIRVYEIIEEDGSICGIKTVKVQLPKSQTFRPDRMIDIEDSKGSRSDIDQVIIAIGAKATVRKINNPAVFFAGDCTEGPTTVVEASAAGKNTGEQVHAYLNRKKIPAFQKNKNGFVKSIVQIPGYNQTPVPLETDFFGRKINSPFLLSASPLTDGFDQLKKAYNAGWDGAIMKTSFDNLPIHIPGEYMFKFSNHTYANCDNVSGHPLDKVCKEAEQLIKLFPDRLTIASTGGSVCGDDEIDKQSWQGNTRKLEAAGIMAIEYSLSCPQGGDGTEGDIVSQNAALSQKIISWVLQSGDANIPKLFKLTGAVTSIEAILLAIKETFDQYPDKKAGITLANTFPTLAFRKGTKKEWEEGVIVGMAGSGALNISYLTLAKAAAIGLHISGNGGLMNYKEAANFLALGCKTVQFCSMPTKMGYHIIDDLKQGLSHLMQERSINSVAELTGRALPDPVTDFMDLTATKKISTVNDELCVQCGNCQRCPYLAINYNDSGYPQTDAEKCIGCKMCNYLCFTGALSMRERTVHELTVLKEN